MGNLSSCTTGLIMGSSTSLQLPHIVRVLLVDGSMLKLKAPITVSKLLVEYPNHVVCSLASLKPGLHALSPLLPDEKLQLGGLYLLLPPRSHAQKARVARKTESAMPKRALNEGVLHEKVGMRSTLPTKKSNGGISSGAESRRNGHLGSRFSSSASELSRKSEVGPQGSALQVRNAIPAKAGRRRRQGERHDQKERYYECRNRRGSLHSQHNTSVDANLCSVRRLCNTPELQRAYLSVMLRRSTSSWTPRLQPINERR
ncbi:hypothetical protein GOP47_0005762 [Adiantum capillus-veneris]|uniref:Uncharacterized protein n=1 Tax=Adiantum capillus-veneris TaxID=13818 RepID=A0A9D4V6W4_ADICA|nr:hypothetical protein GOP47_0005762 [Adiantum capillus-veneris]